MPSGTLQIFSNVEVSDAEDSGSVSFLGLTIRELDTSSMMTDDDSEDLSLNNTVVEADEDSSVRL